MEKTMGLTTGQAYWYIKHFLDNGIIKKLNTSQVIDSISHPQALYRYIGD